MLWVIIGLFIIWWIGDSVFSDNRDIAAWQSGDKKGVVKYFLISAVKIFAYCFFLPFAIMFFFFRD